MKEKNARWSKYSGQAYEHSFNYVLCNIFDSFYQNVYRSSELNYRFFLVDIDCYEMKENEYELKWKWK